MRGVKHFPSQWITNKKCRYLIECARHVSGIISSGLLKVKRFESRIKTLGARKPKDLNDVLLSISARSCLYPYTKCDDGTGCMVVDQICDMSNQCMYGSDEDPDMCKGKLSTLQNWGYRDRMIV